MDFLNTLAAQASTHVAAADAFDIKSLVTNATTWLKVVGGGLITLVGVAAIIFGVIKFLGKLMNNQQNQDKWWVIITMIIAGGAFGLGGGWVVASTLASGGKKTIDDLGNGGGVILMHASTLASMYLGR